MSGKSSGGSGSGSGSDGKHSPTLLGGCGGTVKDGACVGGCGADGIPSSKISK